MKTLRIFPLISVLVISLFVGCSSDDDDKPDPIPGEKTTMTIGSSGGDITLNAFTLRVPAGAFQESHSLTITETNTGETGFEEVFSKTYEVEGIPGDYALPIEVGLISDTDLPEGSRFALQEEGFVTSLDTVATKTRILNTKADAFEMWAVLDAPEDGLQSGNSEAEPREEAKLEFSLFGISSYATYTTSDGKFAISFPAEHLDKIYTLGANLSEAYTTIENIGFSFDERTNWPMEVTVKNLKASVFGYASASIWGENYGSIEINLLHINKAAELKTTVGHELLHVAQSLYDPRNSFSKAKFASSHLWLDEAVSVWFERIISGDPTYVSPVFETAAATGLIGAQVAQSATYRADYGYAQAPLIQYIENEFGRDKIAKFYDEIAKGKSAFDAINQSLPQSISSFWHDYLDELLTFSIYSSDGFGPSWLIGNAFRTELPSSPFSTFGSGSGPLSAKLYYFRDPNDYTRSAHGIFELQESASSDQQVHVFKFNSSGAEHLGTAPDSVFVKDYNQLLDNGYKVVAVVASSGLDLTPGAFDDYQFNPFVIEEINLSFFRFNLSVKSTEMVTKPDTSYTHETTLILSNSFYYSNNSGPMSFNRSGNAVTYSYSYTYVNTTFNTTATISFDDLSTGIPRRIESFSIVQESTDGNYERRISMQGQNVDFRSEYSFHEFGVFDNPSAQISNVTHRYTSPNRTDQLSSFDASEGQMTIRF
jgi:hypothetical protein